MLLIKHRLMKYPLKCALAIPAGGFSVDISTQFIRDKQYIIPKHSIKFRPEVWAALCTQE